ncbi:PadR family transcriptional regulator [Candidatus Micrarchaeota archaeon]|nr:PadR family transcriptional regulator [Candidatus Micrarchaeota archaeon]
MKQPSDRLRDSLTKGNLWLYILTLMKKNEVYGYELNDKIEKEFKFKPQKIMMYLVLYKLENSGLVKSVFKERRKYYKITEKGKQELKKGKKILKEIVKQLK